MTSRLIAIDPGKKSGLASFADGKLTHASRFDGDTGPPAQVAGLNVRVVVEIPCEEKKPRTDRQSASVDDLIALAFRAGYAAGKCACIVPPQKVKPISWKGNQPKDVCHAKARKLLSADEAAIFDRCGPDERDAIALGLWALNR